MAASLQAILAGYLDTSDHGEEVNLSCARGPNKDHAAVSRATLTGQAIDEKEKSNRRFVYSSNVMLRKVGCSKSDHRQLASWALRAECCISC